MHDGLRSLVFVIGAILWLLPAALPADPVLQPHDSIRTAVRRFLAAQDATPQGQTKITVGYLDPRLRLARCSKPLEVSSDPGNHPYGNTSVAVRCSGPRPWKLYVQATVRALRPVVVTTQPLARGTLIGPNDVTMAPRDLAQLGYGYIEHIADALGKQTKRPLGGGIALNPGELVAPKLVRRGEQVTIIAGTRGIEVRMSGVALADGAHNQVIEVRNTKTHRIVEGVVESPDVVRVRM